MELRSWAEVQSGVECLTLVEQHQASCHSSAHYEPDEQTCSLGTPSLVLTDQDLDGPDKGFQTFVKDLCGKI